MPELMKSKINWPSKLLKLLSGQVGLVIVFFLIVIVFSSLSEYFLQSQNLLNVTRQVSINLIVAVGMTFVILTGEIDLSVGSVAALAGVATAVVMTATGSIFLGILAGIGIGVLTGLINGIFTVYTKIQSFIVTLAMLGITRGIALAWTNGKPVSHLPEVFGFWGAGYIGKIPTSSVVALVIFILGFLILNMTKHGRYFLATGANREAANLSTIPTNRYRMLAFVICGVLSAIGGILITSRLLSAQPTAADGLEMTVIAAVILGGASLSGGTGTALGTFMGAFVIGVIDNGMNLIGISAFFQQIVKGIIILLAVLMKRDKE